MKKFGERNKFDILSLKLIFFFVGNTVIIMCRFGNKVLVVALVLLSSAIVSIQGELTKHLKPAPYSLNTEHPENYFFLKKMADTSEVLDTRFLRVEPSRDLENPERESVSDRESVEEEEEEVDISEQEPAEPVETTARATARGPTQIGDHFPIKISSEHGASQIQPDVSISEKDTRWVYHLCHSGASFISVHFADLGKFLRCCIITRLIR
jgi:hypothetical protein